MNRHLSRNRQQGVISIFLLLMALALFVYAAPSGAKPGNGKGPPDKDPGFQDELRIQWTLELAASFSQVRPAIGPDGSIHAVDAQGNLYIVASNGAATVVADAGGKGVDVGPDGTIYTGNETWIKAFNPDGSPKWTFTQAPRAFILSDVAVGPDGNIYAVASNGMGVFSLTPDGEERWRSPEIYDRSNASYTEIAFGPGAGGDQLYFRANQDTRGLTLDGDSVFALALGADRPVVSPFDGSWHRSDSAYDPDGNLLWQFTGFPAATGATVPALGTDGTHYTVNQGFRLFAINPFGRQPWSTELDENVGEPDIDPGNSQLIMPTAATPTRPAALKAVTADDGSDLWRLELPLPAAPAAGLPFIDTPLAFSPDGTTAYVISGVAGGNATLYALSIDPSIPNASTLLRSADVNLKFRSRRQGSSFTGEVTVRDENRAAISGATVTATWSSISDGTLETQTATTDRKGIAKFSIASSGGIYTLTVDAIVKPPYTYDPDHSIQSGSLAGF